MQSSILLPFFVYITFCRNKTARTITYSQFREALSELARKRFKDKTSEEAAEEVFKLIEGKSPIISGVTVITATEQNRFYRMHKDKTVTNIRF